jgi:hypothetical protein
MIDSIRFNAVSVEQQGIRVSCGQAEGREIQAQDYSRWRNPGPRGPLGELSFVLIGRASVSPQELVAGLMV